MDEDTRKIKKRKQSKSRAVPLVRVIALAFTGAVCLAALTAAGLLSDFQRSVEDKFGPPGSALSLQQQVVYSFRLLANEENLTTALDPQGTRRPFDIAAGESVDTIAYRLETERLIGNADAFRTYLIYTGYDRRVRAGKYQLSPAMTAIEIAQELQDAVPDEVTFNILPGWRSEEIADALPTSGIQVSPGQFLQVVRDPSPDLLPAGAEDAQSLEGFLFPGSYQVKREISAKALAAVFTQGFEQALPEDVRQGLDSQGLTLPEAVALASIVEREAVVDDEMTLIASVFLNRLANGMRLESDPTVQYALGTQRGSAPFWKSPLSSADLRIESRYNTYIYPGLPPGSIANPGAEALRAVAFPAQTNFFFFRAQCDGSGRHFFAVTYDEHLKNACP